MEWVQGLGSEPDSATNSLGKPCYLVHARHCVRYFMHIFQSIFILLLLKGETQRLHKLPKVTQVDFVSSSLWLQSWCFSSCTASGSGLPISSLSYKRLDLMKGGAGRGPLLNKLICAPHPPRELTVVCHQSHCAQGFPYQRLGLHQGF